MSSEPHIDQRTRKVISLIERKLSNPPSLNDLAASVNLSASRLRHLFKEEVGKTPAQYLKSLRMQKASQLLRTTFLGVKEIMNQVGLSNESHFIQDFKRAYGLTPAQYRSKHSAQSNRVAISDNE
jgi:transcriptional regulator GlxA family with amidase domain